MVFLTPYERIQLARGRGWTTDIPAQQREEPFRLKLLIDGEEISFVKRFLKRGVNPLQLRTLYETDGQGMLFAVDIISTATWCWTVRMYFQVSQAMDPSGVLYKEVFLTGPVDLHPEFNYGIDGTYSTIFLFVTV